MKRDILKPKNVEITDPKLEESIIEIPRKLELPREETYVVFDLETGGRKRTSDILQISAGSFNVYCIPNDRILDEASAVNGITFDRATNTMYHRGRQVQCKPIQVALLDFMGFLKKQNKPILVGHNVCAFDIPILTNQLSKFKLLNEFSTHVSGFMDTLKIAKRVIPKSDVTNYKQETLVQKFTTCSYAAHDAREDVRALEALFEEKLKKELKQEDLYHILYSYILKKYETMLDKKAITTTAAQKLSQNGVTPFHLHLAHTRNSGLKLLLQGMKVKLTVNYLTSLVQFLGKEE